MGTLRPPLWETLRVRDSLGRRGDPPPLQAPPGWAARTGCRDPRNRPACPREERAFTVSTSVLRRALVPSSRADASMCKHGRLRSPAPGWPSGRGSSQGAPHPPSRRRPPGAEASLVPGPGSRGAGGSRVQSTNAHPAPLRPARRGSPCAQAVPEFHTPIPECRDGRNHSRPDHSVMKPGDLAS